MIYTILGGGFGLYGYLPALIARNSKVLLDLKYRKRLLERADLRKFDCQINWVSSAEVALNEVNSIIIATPPAYQSELVGNILNRYSNINEFFLEKPLAQNPEVAEKLLMQLEGKSKNAAVGFLFLKSPWAEKLQDSINFSKEINIIWHFKAYHYAQEIETWKRHHDLGGGALRFYGIHIIALLSSMGFSEAIESIVFKNHNSEVIRWKASFIGRDLPKCNIEIDIQSDSQFFQVIAGAEIIASMTDPFDDVINVKSFTDRRLQPLVEHLNSGARQDLTFLHQVNNLWHVAEKIID